MHNRLSGLRGVCGLDDDGIGVKQQIVNKEGALNCIHTYIHYLVAGGAGRFNSTRQPSAALMRESLRGLAEAADLGWI